MIPAPAPNLFCVLFRRGHCPTFVVEHQLSRMKRRASDSERLQPAAGRHWK